MAVIGREVDRVAAEIGFSGVVRIHDHHQTDVTFARAYGLANRAYRVRNSVDTQFGIASGSKGMTALAVVQLVEARRLSLQTTARSVLGDDLPLVDDGVTIEHLLAHRSGIGEYLDESGDADVDDVVLPVPVSSLARTECFLPLLDGHPQVFDPGSRFEYCNSGFVVLALIAERVAAVPFHSLVEDRVCRAGAGMRDTAFLRSDELPGRPAIGYLGASGAPLTLRTNVMHLPVRGNGDGGIYTTAADMDEFWSAFFAGRIVSREWVATMIEPRSQTAGEERRYGLGFWLAADGPAVMLEGFDPGVSFRSAHDPVRGVGYTVVSNTSWGAWPLARLLDSEVLGLEVR